MFNSILSTLLLISATILIIVFAYYTTIIIGKKTNKLMTGRYTEVLERTQIGINSNITILKINKKIYIISLQGKSMNTMDIIDENDWVMNNKSEEFPYVLSLNKNVFINKIQSKLLKKR